MPLGVPLPASPQQHSGEAQRARQWVAAWPRFSCRGGTVIRARVQVWNSQGLAVRLQPAILRAASNRALSLCGCPLRPASLTNTPFQACSRASECFAGSGDLSRVRERHRHCHCKIHMAYGRQVDRVQPVQYMQPVLCPIARQASTLTAVRRRTPEGADCRLWCVPHHSRVAALGKDPSDSPADGIRIGLPRLQVVSHYES